MKKRLNVLGLSLKCRAYLVFRASPTIFHMDKIVVFVLCQSLHQKLVKMAEKSNVKGVLTLINLIAIVPRIGEERGIRGFKN